MIISGSSILRLYVKIKFIRLFFKMNCEQLSRVVQKNFSNILAEGILWNIIVTHFLVNSDI